MSWDDYGYGRTDSIDECYVSGDGYTDMYGNMGHGYGYSDFGRPFPPLQNPPYYGGVYGNHSLVPFPPASQHVPLSPFLRKEKRRMPPAMESPAPAPIPPKKPKSIRNHQAEFEAYLLELPEEHREVAKTLAEQLKSFKSGRLRLPDQEFVPVPVELLPTTETALLDEEIKIDAGCMETAFHHGADTVKMGLISLSPWPEASSLKEINQHPNKDQVPLDIIESLKNEDNIGPLCFGRLVGEELKKIEAHKRVDVARRIMMALTTSTNHVGPPDTKKRRLDQS